jgi:hypothetical protein
MAENKRIRAGSGMIADPPRVRLGDKGELTAFLLSQLNDTLRDVVNSLNGRLSLGDGVQSSWAGNLDGQWIELVTPGVADSEFAVPHGLGKVPSGYLVVRKDQAAHLYDSNVGGWSEDTIYLKCDVVSVTFSIIVFR